MNSDDASKIFICSYCEQSLKFRNEQEGKRTLCPKCKKAIWIFENRTQSIELKLTSSWKYEQPKLLGFLGSKKVGPVTDIEFLGLIARGNIDRETIVQSPELTLNQETTAGKVNVSIIREMCSQREAEIQRRRNLQVRETQRDSKNRETLLQGIKKAIADGNLSLNELTQLQTFAAKTGIVASEVETLLKVESRNLLTKVVEDALSDGLFDDQENERISKIAIGLGISLEFTEDQQFRLELARFAWTLLGQLQSDSLPKSMECTNTEAYEVVSLKRPLGIPLGDDHYLKLIGTGDAKLIDKNFLIDGRLTVKKYSLSSIVDVTWYSDGLFLKRSSGKSVFLRPVKFGLNWYQFVMSVKVLIMREPVIGVLPDEAFIPVVASLVDGAAIDNNASEEPLYENDDVHDSWQPSIRIPKYTFRVVGESFENRSVDLNNLTIGEAVYLVREPENPFDSNAVSVVNREQRMLGYLKRDVSLWFAPVLDRGQGFQCEVKQRTSSGGIVIAVFGK